MPIKLGILGAGSFVRRRILPILNNVPEITVTVVQKRDENEAKKLADKFHIPYAVSTREALLNHKEVEAVFIATPNHCHEDDGIAAAYAKKPTLCEKPLATTSKAILKMQKAFAKNKTPLFVGQSLRFKPALQKARKYCSEGSLGRLLHVSAFFSYPGSKENWRFKDEAGGGALQDVGVHLIDLIHFVTGSIITKVKAIDKFTSTVALGELENGATFSFECAIDRPLRSGFEVIGEKARLLSQDSLRQTDIPKEKFFLINEDDSTTEIPIEMNNIYIDELKHFANVLRGKEVSIIDSDVGLQNQRVIDSIRKN